MGGNPRRDPADILSIGFGTSIAMWALIYVGQLPQAHLPAPVLLALLLALVAAGGYAFGRFSTRPLRGAAWCGVVTGLINLLLIGSLIGGKEPNHFRPAAYWLPPVSLLTTMSLMAGGAALGRRRAARRDANWPAVFAAVAASATVLLIAIGGVVTGYEAGLAVVDWPNTFGHNMFLYPREKMTGNIYFEHAHRLMGSLVGLTTLSLAVYAQLREPRRWVRGLAWLALVVVVGQGLLGALRVTGHFTLSQSPQDTSPDVRLAIVHGLLAQVFLCLLFCLSAVLSRAWRTADRAPHASAGVDRVLTILLIVAFLAQSAVGALLRHVAWGLHLHLTIAALAIGLALAIGIRLYGLYEHRPALSTLGALLAWGVGVQLMLGFGALFVTSDDQPGQRPPAFDVILTTAHQTTGALLLGLAALAAAWHWRCCAAPARDAPEAARPLPDSAEKFA